MIDKTLIDTLQGMASKEKKIDSFRRRLRIKGAIIAKGMTKKENIILKIKKEEDEYTFTILKTHKERYALAKSLLRVLKSFQGLISD